MKNNRLYFEHMLEAIKLVERYARGFNYNQFTKDTEKQDAIVRRLQIIGEASNRVPQEIKTRLPNVPWKQMLGMRNIIVHDYMYVDLQKVWSVIEDDLPKLKQIIQAALKKLGSGS